MSGLATVCGVTTAPPSAPTIGCMEQPHVVVLFGATGDLARRKLLPGSAAPATRRGCSEDCRIVGTSLDDLDTEQFVKLAREARRRVQPAVRRDLLGRLRRAAVASSGRATARRRWPTRSREAEKQLGAGVPDEEISRLHYLSVPPKAALARRPPARRGRPRRAVPDHHGEAVRHRPRRPRRSSTPRLHEVFDEEQIFRIDHFLGKEAAQNILAFRFANGLFEPIWNRNFIDHVQIDVPETLGLEMRAVVLRVHRRLPRHGRHPPDAGAGVHGDGAADLAGSRARSATRSSRCSARCSRSSRTTWSAASTSATASLDEVADDSDTETFIALKVEIDNWRWAGVPFFLRTGKKLAEGARIISIAFKEPPRTMFPQGSGVGAAGPDHLTFDLADQSRMSLSFYGKRPGPGHEAREAVDAVRHPRDRQRPSRCWRPTSG